MTSQEEQYRRSLNSFVQQAQNSYYNQDKEGFKRTMRDYESQFLQNEAQSNQIQYLTQKRINDNYLPAQNTLSDNFLQQTFLSDTNSFVQYQRIVNVNNPQQMEALNQHYQSLPPFQKQFVRPNANIEFKEDDLPLQYQRFKVPKTSNNSYANQQNPLFDHDTTLFARNVLTLCENQIQQTTPQHLKNYIDILGGIEDTIASINKFKLNFQKQKNLQKSAMESSLKLSELKNLEDKYINYYGQPLGVQAQAQAQPQSEVLQPIPQANPFFKKPSETLVGTIPLVQAAYVEQTLHQDYNNREDHFEDNQYSFQNEKPSLNPIIEQSKKLREEKMKFLQNLK